ncbi:MAG TPA: PQQ-dependent sugar dehydrogenase [Anaerolineae bacterium]|nr:PQQ-dependent sugar dehydrogenase [Anaerolineae bacterium]
MAFHPNYETNGYFYVNFTDNAGDTRIVRYSASSNPDVANPNSALTLLTVEQPYANHNGGQLLFGRDGYLYIGMGDGGSGGDPDHRAQDLNQLLGKMLRINVTGVTTYTIPADNPYVGKPGLDEIWAVGLRNPWRFSFDRLNGDLYIGDVGQNAWEEVDYQAYGTPGGVNFGWPCREGAHVYPSSDPRCSNSSLIASLTPPIVEYASTGLYQAVAGGFVYRGGDFPRLFGRYFFADYAAGSIWSVTRSGSGWSQRVTEIDSTGFAISSFGEDERGELYVVDYSGGTIRRLVYALNRTYLPIIYKNY